MYSSQVPNKRVYSIRNFRFFPHPTRTFSTLLVYWHPRVSLGLKSLGLECPMTILSNHISIFVQMRFQKDIGPIVVDRLYKAQCIIAFGVK